jgi:hypothetical protein
MTAALIIYVVLTSAHRWEFMAIEQAGNMSYCEMLRDDVKRVFSDRPGNIRILCVDDERVEA